MPESRTDLPDNAFTSRIAKHVRAVLRERGVEAKHTDILHGIARACGVKDAPTLRALAAAELPADPDTPDNGDCSHFHTRYVIDVFAQGSPVMTESLERLGHLCGDGDCVGVVSARRATPLTPEACRQELEAAGANPDWFEPLPDDAWSGELPELERLEAYHVQAWTSSGMADDPFQAPLHGIECYLAARSRGEAKALAAAMLEAHGTFDPRVQPIANVRAHEPGWYDSSLSSPALKALIDAFGDRLRAERGDGEPPEITPRMARAFLEARSDDELWALIGSPGQQAWTRETLMAEIAAVAVLQDDWDDDILGKLA